MAVLVVKQSGINEKISEWCEGERPHQAVVHMVCGNGWRGILKISAEIGGPQGLPTAEAFAPNRRVAIDRLGRQKFVKLVGGYRALALAALRIKPRFVARRRVGQIGPPVLMLCCVAWIQSGISNVYTGAKSGI